MVIHGSTKRMSISETYQAYGHKIGSVHDYIHFLKKIKKSEIPLRVLVGGKEKIVNSQIALGEKIKSAFQQKNFIKYILSNGLQDDLEVGGIPISIFYFNKSDVSRYFEYDWYDSIEDLTSPDIKAYIKSKNDSYESYTVINVKKTKGDIELHEEEGRFREKSHAKLLKFLVEEYHSNPSAQFNIDELVKKFGIWSGDKSRPPQIKAIFYNKTLAKYFKQDYKLVVFVHPSEH